MSEAEEPLEDRRSPPGGADGPSDEEEVGEDHAAGDPPRPPERLPVEPRELGDLGTSLRPLRDLAEAFRAHSDALRALAEGQARIGRRLEKTDRSEAVIQSTRALNETFRGVQRTQERLMGRLDREGKRPFALVIGALAALAVFVGGTLYLVLGWLERREGVRSDRDRASVDRLVTDQTDRLEKLHERLGEKGGEAADLARRLASESGRVEDLEARLAEKEAEVRDLEGARGALTRTLRENASLSSEVARLSAELARVREELARARSDLAEAESRLEAGTRPAGGTAGGEPVAAASPPESTESRGNVPAEAVTDEGELRRISTVLNGLLLGTRESDGYRILRIGGARGKVLYEVTAVHVDTDGRETKRIEADELRIVVDEALRRALLRFSKGRVLYHGVRAPFWGGSYEVQVQRIDPDAWRRSGLTILDRR